MMGAIRTVNVGPFVDGKVEGVHGRYLLRGDRKKPLAPRTLRVRH
jgi:hypothetical protein